MQAHSEAPPKLSRFKATFRRLTKRGQSTESTPSNLDDLPSAPSVLTVQDTPSAIAVTISGVEGAPVETGVTHGELPSPNLSPAEEQQGPGKLVKVKKVAGTAFDVFLLGIDGLAAASDAFPPAKSAAGGFQHIIDVCRNVQDGKEDDRQFLHRVEALSELLRDSVEDSAHLQPRLEQVIADFHRVLEEASNKTKNWLGKNFLGQLVRLCHDTGKQRSAHKDVEHAFQDFILRALYQSIQELNCNSEALAQIKGFAMESCSTCINDKSLTKIIYDMATALALGDFTFFLSPLIP